VSQRRCRSAQTESAKDSGHYLNGAKLVSKEEKETLDEWYVRNASLWVDLQIALMTIKVILRGLVSSAEILADTEQVRSKNIGLERTNTF
jgi:hypothetical protein